MEKCKKKSAICNSDNCNCKQLRVCEKVKSPQEWDEYFHVTQIKDFEDRYVLFVDIMGMKTTMFRSFNRSTIFMGKFHSCLSKLAKDSSEIVVFPVMDGAYVVAKEYDQIVEFIRNMYVRIARIFILTKNNSERFLIRGGLAYGPVVLGEDITGAVSPALGNEEQYKSKLLFGLPVILAYEGESKASPFGVYLDATIRIKMRNVVSGVRLKWCFCPSLQNKLAKEADSYFNWASQHAKELLYSEDRISAHHEMAKQFFNKEI